MGDINTFKFELINMPLHIMLYMHMDEEPHEQKPVETRPRSTAQSDGEMRAGPSNYPLVNPIDLRYK